MKPSSATTADATAPAPMTASVQDLMQIVIVDVNLNEYGK